MRHPASGLHLAEENIGITPMASKLRNDILLSLTFFIAASDAPHQPSCSWKQAVRSPEIVHRTAGQHLEREYGKKPEAGAEVVGMASKQKTRGLGDQ